jgi:diguanylate cyclase (GGDEF)-like protein
MTAPKNSIVVIDPAQASRGRACALLAELGYAPREAGDAFDAHAVVDGARAVVAVHLVAEAVYPRLRAEKIPLILSFGARQPGPAALAAHLGADAYVLRPYRADTLSLALYAADSARLLRERAERAEKALAALAGQPLTQGRSLLHVDLFKTLLPTEIKRAQRHGYPISLMVVAFDSPDPGREASARVATQCEPLLRQAVRDVDLAVRYAENRFLVVLPHTDAAGAQAAAHRILSFVEREAPRARGQLPAQVSVGIAASRPDKPPSFSQMVRDAHTALRAAQQKRGGQAGSR